MILRWLVARLSSGPTKYRGAPRDAEWEHADNWSGYWARCRLADGRAGTGVGATKYSAQRQAHHEARNKHA